MRLLLDTHVLLALLDGRLAALGRGIESVFKTGEHTFFVSVASLWEIAIKWRLGKLPLNVAPDQLPELLDDMGLAMLTTTAEHVLATVDPEPVTRDPFDRLLLGVCGTDGLQLLTVDHSLVDHRLVVKV